MRLLCLGDSHAMYTFAGVADAKLYWVGPITMHRAARDGIEVLVPKYLKPGLDDVIVLCFGEIDCRAHIRKQADKNGTSTIAEVDLLTDRYASALAAFDAKTEASIVLCCVPPFVRENLNCEQYVSTEDCAFDAKQIRERMNYNLARLGYLFVDFYDAVAQSDGSFKSGFSDGVCHLDSRRSAPVIFALKSMFDAEFTHREPPWPHPRQLVEKPPTSRAQDLGKAIERLLKSLFLKLPGAALVRGVYKSRRSQNG